MGRKKSGTITVKNHSNAAVTAGALFDKNSESEVTTNGVTATLLNNTGFTLDTAEGTTPDGAPYNEIGVGIDGIPTTTTEFTVDTITVTISPSSAQTDISDPEDPDGE